MSSPKENKNSEELSIAKENKNSDELLNSNVLAEKPATGDAAEKKPEDIVAERDSGAEKSAAVIIATSEATPRLEGDVDRACEIPLPGTPNEVEEPARESIEEGEDFPEPASIPLPPATPREMADDISVVTGKEMDVQLSGSGADMAKEQKDTNSTDDLQPPVHEDPSEEIAASSRNDEVVAETSVGSQNGDHQDPGEKDTLEEEETHRTGDETGWEYIWQSGKLKPNKPENNADGAKSDEAPTGRVRWGSQPDSGQDEWQQDEAAREAEWVSDEDTKPGPPEYKASFLQPCEPIGDYPKGDVDKQMEFVTRHSGQQVPPDVEKEFRELDALLRAPSSSCSCDAPEPEGANHLDGAELLGLHSEALSDKALDSIREEIRKIMQEQRDAILSPNRHIEELNKLGKTVAEYQNETCDAIAELAGTVEGLTRRVDELEARANDAVSRIEEITQEVEEGNAAISKLTYDAVDLSQTLGGLNAAFYDTNDMVEDLVEITESQRRKLAGEEKLFHLSIEVARCRFEGLDRRMSELVQQFAERIEPLEQFAKDHGANGGGTGAHGAGSGRMFNLTIRKEIWILGVVCTLVVLPMTWWYVKLSSSVLPELYANGGYASLHGGHFNHFAEQQENPHFLIGTAFALFLIAGWSLSGIIRHVDRAQP